MEVVELTLVALVDTLFSHDERADWMAQTRWDCRAQVLIAEVGSPLMDEKKIEGGIDARSDVDEMFWE